MAIDPAAVSVRQLYKDCMRLARHVGAVQGNGEALRRQVREAFAANKHEKDPGKIDEQKMAAVRGLGNYALLMSGMLRDPNAPRDGEGDAGAEEPP